MGLTRYNYQTRDIPDMVGHRTHEDIIDKWWLMMATVGSAEQFGCISRGHRQQHIVIGTMISYWCLAGNDGMIPVITSNNHPSNPQQPPATHPFPTFSTSKILHSDAARMVYHRQAMIYS